MTDGTGTWADATWESAERRQIRLGLSLTPAQRLQWLEETLDWIFRMQAINGVRPGGPRCGSAAGVAPSAPHVDVPCPPSDRVVGVPPRMRQRERDAPDEP